MHARTDPQVTTGTMYPSASHAWTVLTLLMLASLLSFLDRQVLALLVEPIKAQLRISDVQMSLLQGLAFVLLYSLAALPVGYAVDRLNRHRIIVFGLVIWGAATAACSLTHTYTELFIARLFVGIGEATLLPAAYSLISDLFAPERRARAFTLFASAGIVGVSFSFFLGGAVVKFAGDSGLVQVPLLGAVPPWQFVFILAGLPALLLAAVMLYFPEPPRVGIVTTTATAGTAELLSTFRSRKASFTVVFAAFGLAVFAGYGTLAWMAAAYSRIHHLSVGEAGLLCGVILLCGGFGGVLVGGTLADRWTRLNVVGGKLLVATAAGLPACLLLSAWWLVDSVAVSALVAVLGCSLSFGIGGVGPAVLSDMVPNELRGKVSAVYLLMTAVVGYALGPFCVAFMTEHAFGGGAGIRFSLLVMSGAYLISAAVAWMGRTVYWRSVLECRKSL